MQVRVLGSGCAKCQRLFAEAERAIADSGISARLEKVEDPGEIAGYGVMVTPALVIEGQVKTSGRIPASHEIAGWLQETAKGTG